MPDWKDAEAVLGEIKAALAQALPSEGVEAGGQKLEGVELLLKVAADRTVGVGIKFKVPLIGLEGEAGGALHEEHLQTLHLELSPPQGRHESAPASVQEELVEGLRALERLARAAGDGDYPLELRAGTLELSFTFDRSGKASLVVKAEGKHSSAHTIRLRVSGSTSSPSHSPTKPQK